MYLPTHVRKSKGNRHETPDGEVGRFRIFKNSVIRREEIFPGGKLYRKYLRKGNCSSSLILKCKSKRDCVYSPDTLKHMININCLFNLFCFLFYFISFFVSVSDYAPSSTLSKRDSEH